MPTLSWRKTSRVANPHLHLSRSKARQDQRSSTVLFQTPPPPQDPCTPSLPQHPCTPCSPLDNYESLPFSVTRSYHGIVKSVKRTRTLETKLDILTCHLSQCHWVKRAQLTDVSSLPPTPSAPTLPVCTTTPPTIAQTRQLALLLQLLAFTTEQRDFHKSDTISGIQQYQEQLHLEMLD